MPKVSVIVPVYNTSKYLKRCLEALVHQTLQDIEILLINDGSTDNSREVLTEYEKAFPNIIKIVDKENGGQATARNLGFTIAAGDYIGFADSDDCVDVSLFEKLYYAAIESDADMAECLYRYIQEDGNGEKELPPRGRVRKYKNQKDMFIDVQAAPWNKLYKKSIIVDNNITFPVGVLYEDTAFFLKTIPYVNSSVFVNEQLVNYYLHAGSTMTRSTNKEKRVADIFPVLQDVLDFYKTNGFYDDYEDELEYFSTKILLCSHLERVGRVRDKQIKKALLDRTFKFIADNFPGYKNNPHIGGKVGMYMKLVNRRNAYLASGLMSRILKG